MEFQLWTQSSLILLQHVYKSFDEIDKLCKIFKDETINDLHVAMTVLLELQAKHAIIMTCFVQMFILNMMEVTCDLEKWGDWIWVIWPCDLVCSVVPLLWESCTESGCIFNSLMIWSIQWCTSKHIPWKSQFLQSTVDLLVKKEKQCWDKLARIVWLQRARVYCKPFGWYHFPPTQPAHILLKSVPAVKGCSHHNWSKPMPTKSKQKHLIDWKMEII